MKYVKSVLGGFSSGVFICSNRGPQSDLLARIWPGGLTLGVFPPALKPNTVAEEIFSKMYGNLLLLQK